MGDKHMSLAEKIVIIIGWLSVLALVFKRLLDCLLK